MPLLATTNFLQALGWAVINSFWQMAFLWLMFKLVITLYKSLSSAGKANMAFIFLSGSLIWFIATFVLSLVTITHQPFVEAIAVTATGNKIISGVLPYTSIIYLCFLIIPVWRFIRNYRYVLAIRQYGLSKTSPEIKMFVSNYAAHLGIKKKVSVWASSFISSPVTVGFLKPVILLPLSIISNLDVAQIEAVLIHELVHIRRHDYFINLLINSIKCILYFNPFTNLFIRVIEQERETVCDKMVLQFQYDPHSYASALLFIETNNHFDNSRLVLPAAGEKHNLYQRVQKIVGIYKKPAVSLKKITFSLLLFLFMFFLNTVLVTKRKTQTSSQPAASGFIAAPDYTSASFNQTDIKLRPDVKKVYEPLIIQKPGKPAIIEKHRLVESKDNNTSISIVKNNEYANSGSNEDDPATMFTPANFIETIIPELTREQEQQLKATLETTKKVLEKEQWEQIEKSYADAVTSLEKETIKKIQKEKIEQEDWKKLENKIRISYNHINWDKINGQLNAAMANIKLDSLQQVITVTVNQLGKLQQALVKNNLKGVPDTDLTADKIKDEREKAKVELEKLKSLRNRRIIRL